MKTVQTDGGGKFINKHFEQFLKTHRFYHQTSYPYTPQQNGAVDYKYQHIIEMGLCLMAQSNLPQKYWLEAFMMSIFLINRLRMRQLKYISPYQTLLLWIPDYHLLKIFGYLCFPHLVPFNKHKLLPKSTPCVFLGYDSTTKGYRCLDWKIGRLYVSRHIVFNENTFPFNNNL